MKRRIGLGTILRSLSVAVVLGWASMATAGTVTVVVDSTAGPWDYVSGGLNDASQYGDHDFTAPTVISAADGFNFTAGGTFTITYISGLTSPYGGAPYADAVGDTGYNASNNIGNSGGVFPSFYFNPTDYPAYLAALVGTFTDSSGQIVGTPFLVGLARSVVVPVGATQIQLGINDDIFRDNTGSLTVTVAGPDAVGVPEPSSFVLGASALALTLGYIRRRK